MPKLRFLCAVILALFAAFLPLPSRADLPALTVLHTFAPAGPDDMTPAHHANAEGARPEAPLVQDRDGALYGTATDGGIHGTGAVFRVETNGTKFAVLHSFGPLDTLFGNDTNPDGARPSAALVCGKEGTLYGVTTLGGPGGSGTVFRLNPDGTGFRVLRSFEAKGDLYHNEGGASPLGLTLGPDSLLYGVAALGGSGRGLLFRLTTDGKNFSVLHSFSNPDYDGNVNTGGSIPTAAIIFGPENCLYGTTNTGGKHGYGVLYKVNADGKHFTVLHEFERKVKDNGVFPSGPLVFGPDGALHGATRQGGDADAGTLYKISTDGTVFTLLHTFSAVRADSADGSLPGGPLVFGSDGFAYGVSGIGGRAGNGILYKINTVGTKFFALHDLSAAEGGGSTGLTRGADGNLYGVSANGGVNRTGTLFRITAH